MATQKKLSRKELAQPDEFVQTGRSTYQWIKDHQRLVIGAAAGLLVLGLVVAIAAWSTDRAEQAAAGALGRALEVAGRPVLPEAADEASDDRFFASEEARREAFRAALTEVVTEHEGTQSAALAALHLGDVAYRAGVPDEAVRWYETFLDETGAGHPYRFAALEGLALVHGGRGEQEQALAVWQRAVDESAPFYRPFAMVKVAEQLADLGRTEEARASAQKVVEDFAESPARSEAEALLARLPAAPATEDAQAGDRQEG